MPATLGTTQTALEDDLNTAYTKARDNGANGVDVIPDLAHDVSTAVHLYMLEALVTTVVEVDTGQLDSLAGSTSTPPPPGSGTGELM
jgi:hypothetical protein